MQKVRNLRTHATKSALFFRYFGDSDDLPGQNTTRNGICVTWSTNDSDFCSQFFFKDHFVIFSVFLGFCLFIESLGLSRVLFFALEMTRGVVHLHQNGYKTLRHCDEKFFAFFWWEQKSGETTRCTYWFWVVKANGGVCVCVCVCVVCVLCEHGNAKSFPKKWSFLILLVSCLSVFNFLTPTYRSHMEKFFWSVTHHVKNLPDQHTKKKSLFCWFFDQKIPLKSSDMTSRHPKVWKWCLVVKDLRENMANFYCPVRTSAWLWKLEFTPKNWNPKTFELFLRVLRHNSGRYVILV